MSDSTLSFNDTPAPKSVFQFNMEMGFIIVILVLLVWYYFAVYKQNRTLSSLFFAPAPVVTPAPAPVVEVPAQPEEFKNDISAFRASGGAFSTDNLRQAMHGL